MPGMLACRSIYQAYESLVLQWIAAVACSLIFANLLKIAFLSVLRPVEAARQAEDVVSGYFVVDA